MGKLEIRNLWGVITKGVYTAQQKDLINCVEEIWFLPDAVLHQKEQDGSVFWNFTVFLDGKPNCLVKHMIFKKLDIHDKDTYVYEMLRLFSFLKSKHKDWVTNLQRPWLERPLGKAGAAPSLPPSGTLQRWTMSMSQSQCHNVTAMRSLEDFSPGNVPRTKVKVDMSTMPREAHANIWRWLWSWWWLNLNVIMIIEMSALSSH